MKRIGIDLGGTFIKGGIVDEDNNILARDAVPTLVEREPAKIIEDMAALIEKLMKENQISYEDIAGIGIGSPGTIDAENGVVLYSNNIRWENVPLAEMLGGMIAKGRGNVPVKISNDANCAALGELVCDRDSSYQSAVLLTLGTGVGSGIILKGKLYEGESAGGAELGHTVICHNGRMCSCGRKGCLEAYVSASALVGDARKAAEEYEASVLNRLAKEEMLTQAKDGKIQKTTEGALQYLNGKHVIGAVRSSDAAAVKVFKQYLEYLGCGITNIVNMFRPEVVYLGGGICEGFELMETYLNDYVKKNAFGGEIAKTAVIRKAAHGNDAGIIGAAALVG